mgnify:CR=1 FL=1
MRFLELALSYSVVLFGWMGYLADITGWRLSIAKANVAIVLCRGLSPSHFLRKTHSTRPRIREQILPFLTLTTTSHHYSWPSQTLPPDLLILRVTIAQPYHSATNPSLIDG